MIKNDYPSFHSPFSLFYQQKQEKCSGRIDREAWVATFIKNCERIGQLAPDTRLMYGPQGEIEPDLSYNLTRAMTGYFSSEWSRDIQNLSFWSNHAVTFFQENPIAESHMVATAIETAKTGLVQLKSNYESLQKGRWGRDKSEQIKSVEESIERLGLAKEAMEENHKAKYDSEQLRPQYIKNKINDRCTQKELAHSLQGRDLERFMTMKEEETALYQQIITALHPSLHPRLDRSLLAATILLAYSSKESEDQAIGLCLELEDIRGSERKVKEKIELQWKALTQAFPSLVADPVEAKIPSPIEEKVPSSAESEAGWRDYMERGAGLLVGASMCGVGAYASGIPGAGLMVTAGCQIIKENLKSTYLPSTSQVPTLAFGSEGEKKIREAISAGDFETIKAVVQEKEKAGKDQLEKVKKGVDEVKEQQVSKDLIETVNKGIDEIKQLVAPLTDKFQRVNSTVQNEPIQ